MIIYKNDAGSFLEELDAEQVPGRIKQTFREKLGRGVADNELRSWRHSLKFMGERLRRADIPRDCGVLIEYFLPASSRRIDFVITGTDEDGNKNLVIVELKQWEDAEKGPRDLVKTIYRGSWVDTPHPSEQARAYRLYLEDYLECVYSGDVSPHSCAYLHNYPERDPEPLRDDRYADLIAGAPLYLGNDHAKLEQFLDRHVNHGQGQEILYEIEDSEIRPSKKLIDHVTGMFEGNKEFVLLDGQKVAYEKSLDIAVDADEKTVLLVNGGPGTGKSVVSVQLLGGLLQEELNASFVAPNAAFRKAMIDRLAGEHTKTRLKNLFKGSSGFVDVEENAYDVLVVDEAHRLKDGSAFMYEGENQVEDILRAARVSIFFVDDNQIIRPEDLGSSHEIRRLADEHAEETHEVKLDVQFRCSGAEGYVNWLDHTLQIRETANWDGWDDEEYEFRIFDDPNALREAILEKDASGGSARLLAGYAWPWTTAKNGNPDAEVEDIQISEHDFSMHWNSRKLGPEWAIKEEGKHQVGCIHTVQGLEFDYVGVIVGDDLKFDPEEMTYYTEWDAYKDAKGKQTLKDHPEKLNELVRNIYKILLSRGMKGCYVYFTDKNVERHVRNRLDAAGATEPSDIPDSRPELYRNALPLIDPETFVESGYDSVKAYLQSGDEVSVKRVPGGPFGQEQFLVRAKEEMIPPGIDEIAPGDLCRFSTDTTRDLAGKIVLVRNREYPAGDPGVKLKRFGSTDGEAEREPGDREQEDLPDQDLDERHQEAADDSKTDLLGVFERTLPREFR